jgi:hypothetical protein
MRNSRADGKHLLDLFSCVPDSGLRQGALQWMQRHAREIRGGIIWDAEARRPAAFLPRV